MSRELAQVRLALHIDRPAESTRDIRAIDAESAGQVDHRTAGARYAPCDAGLVLRGELGRALFHGDVRRIDDAVGLGPLRQLAARSLPAGDLVEREWQVKPVHAFGAERQVAHILIAVRRNEPTGLRRNIHSAMVSRQRHRAPASRSVTDAPQIKLCTIYPPVFPMLSTLFTYLYTIVDNSYSHCAHCPQCVKTHYFQHC